VQPSTGYWLSRRTDGQSAADRFSLGLSTHSLIAGAPEIVESKLIDGLGHRLSRVIFPIAWTKATH
jgi:hypothetical protein